MTIKKVTMKDIAQEVNVSLATVSYVLNHSEKEKISHDTRMKVMETAKRMGYVPNQTARSLANKKSNLIGIIANFNNNSSSSIKYQTMDLVCELQKLFYRAGYDTIFSCAYEQKDIEIKYKHTLDAAIIIDIDENSLKNITKHYYVPLIFMECDFDEGLFYKILPDYTSIIEEAKVRLKEPYPYLVISQLVNGSIQDQITDGFPKEDVFIHKNNTTNLKDFLSQKVNRKGIIIGDLLGSKVERYLGNNDTIVISSGCANDLLLPDTKRIVISSRKKAEAAVDILLKLICFDYDDHGNTRVLVPPDEC